MPTRIIVGLVAGVALLGIYYLESIENAPRPLPAEYTQGPEALGWLRKSKNESALASNRFGETQNAVRFVQQLYSAGAANVIVPMAAIQNDGVEIYADSLVVTLPTDPAKRDRVWKLCAQELRREGDKVADKPGSEEHVLLWWD
ncbi:MAG: hypothetical protein HYX69_00530 [Planctomycetia bacterium]|nr:hypothetical protein [Planctomycetia bacterium]